MRWSWYFDLYQLEHRVVRARNYLYFRTQWKDDPDRRKIFVVGHPRSGTKVFHKLFQGNGLKSQHSPGNWNTRAYDCFSDRGSFQPFPLMAAHYPNSVFILNTRPVYKYIRSVIHHRFGRGRKSKGWFEPSVTNIENEIIERNRDFVRFVRTFQASDNCLVVNIERPGALDFVADHLGLGRREIGNSPRQNWREKDLGKIERAFRGLAIDDNRDEPFVLESLVDDEERALVRRFLEQNSERIRL